MPSLLKLDGHLDWPVMAGCCGTPLAGSEKRNLRDGFPAPNLAGLMRARCPFRPYEICIINGS
jgi:hypothetical protein